MGNGIFRLAPTLADVKKEQSIRGSTRMSELRSAARVRAVLKGEIRYDNGLRSTACVIRDISDTGARLELPSDLALPDHFDLYIEKKKQPRPAIMKRRRGVDIGVAFVEAVDAPTLTQLTERVAKLEAEVANLRGLLEKAQHG